MKRAIIIALIFIITISIGTVELVSVKKVLSSMENSIIDLNQEFEQNSESISDYYDKVSDIKDYWVENEDWLCYLFNHRDLSIVTDSMNRLQAYTKNNDYDNAIAELALLKEYSTKNCHIMGFNIHNIL